MVELYLHYLIRPYGVVRNEMSPGTTLSSPVFLRKSLTWIWASFRNQVSFRLSVASRMKRTSMGGQMDITFIAIRQV
jgi:hypothetical protein